ncbi:protein LURP-one-related 15-like [Glycine soja]|nr:protein LURP-one-related 15-like [Glycine soja]RZB52987.1 Protein LURP-one-related 15 [Glycine soja]
MAFPVISSDYCAPYAINLQINTKTGFTYDANNACRFYIEDKLFTLHKRRVLCDNQGNPIVTLYKKRMTLHGRCQVFRGYKSKDFSQLLFSVKRSSMIPSGMVNLEVFLANNQRESACDFRVNVCRDKRSCTVYAGESPRIVATMENNGGFNVLVDPYVDYAFIVALLMIVSEMKHYFDEMVNLAAGMTIALGSSMT